MEYLGGGSALDLVSWGPGGLGTWWAGAGPDGRSYLGVVLES